MVFKVIVHEEAEGGYWAEVPALPGCLTQADTMEELRLRAREAIEAYLGLDETGEAHGDQTTFEIAV